MHWSILSRVVALTHPQLRSLKYVLLPDSTADNPRGTMYAVNRTQKNRRTQFLFVYSYIVQVIFMWSLSSGFGNVTSGKK